MESLPFAAHWRFIFYVVHPTMADLPDPHVVSSNLRIRRDIAKASVTHLITGVAKFEGKADMPNVGNDAKHLLTRLQEASAEFKQTHQ